MNLLELCLKITQKKNRNTWVETQAHFTGETEECVERSSRYGSIERYKRYKYVYYVDDVQKHGWHTFFPLEDLDEDEVKDTWVRIRYNRKKPYLSELIEDDLM